MRYTRDQLTGALRAVDRQAKAQAEFYDSDPNWPPETTTNLQRARDILEQIHTHPDPVLLIQAALAAAERRGQKAREAQR